MIGQWLLGFIGSYILVSVLGAALWSHVSLGGQFAIALPLALIGAWLRVAHVRHKRSNNPT